MQISCIVVDDEPLAIDKMKAFISKISFLDLKATFNSGIEAMNFLRDNTVELLFLDIQMDDLTGIQLVELLEVKPLIVFTTAYDQYALKGYELDVCDYLLKPISFQRFLKTANKVYARLLPGDSALVDVVSEKIVNTEDQNQHKEFCFLKTENRMQKVLFGDILMIQGMKDYLLVQTTKGNIMTLSNFKSMLELLPLNEFKRVHKSYIVPISKIESIERNRIKIGESLIPISDTYKKEFYEFLDKSK